MVTSYITRYQSSAVLTKNPEIVSLAGEPDRPRATIHNHQEMLLFANRHQYPVDVIYSFFIILKIYYKLSLTWLVHIAVRCYSLEEYMLYSIASVRRLDLVEIFLVCVESWRFLWGFSWVNVRMLLHPVSISLAEPSYLVSNVRGTLKSWFLVSLVTHQGASTTIPRNFFWNFCNDMIRVCALNLCVAIRIIKLPFSKIWLLNVTVTL
jgi:hypothetical protein